MEKTATLNIRVKPGIKENAERIISELGISMSSAIDMYLRQIILVGGIPFDIIIPEAPDSLNADFMSDEEFLKDLEEGIKDAREGRTQSLEEAFAEFKEKNFGKKVRSNNNKKSQGKNAANF